MDQNNKKKFLFVFVNDAQKAQLLLDEEAMYSTTDQNTANKISEYIKHYFPDVKTITDGTACIGGNTYSFSRYFENVNAIEINKKRYDYLKHNLYILNTDNVAIYNGSVTHICPNLKQDLIFLDPPWGGPSYKFKTKITNLYLSELELSEVTKELSKYTKYICIKIPNNFDVTTFTNRTSNYMTLLLHNKSLRKMQLIIYQVNNSN
jgi:16S rRNA G966 N2-methylase RsmD